MSKSIQDRRWDDGLEWLIAFAEREPHCVDHYYHICDGDADTCGCRFQGKDAV